MQGDDAQRGVLAEWHDDRGFGFITPDAGGPRVFAHVSAFPSGRRPAAGDEVTYAEGRDERNRPRAAAVRYLVERSQPASRGAVGALVVAALVLALLAVLVAAGRLHLLIPTAYGLMSALTFATYAVDKSAARNGTFRVAESTLHLLDLACGWPGGLIARHYLRHKTRKQPFRLVFWLTVVVNCGVLAAFAVGIPMPELVPKGELGR